MKIIDTSIRDVKIIEPSVYGDERGFFLESWSHKAFSKADLPTTFVQDNHSRSAQGILRGLHYQTEHPQGKLVRVTSGAVFDVAVDLRRESPTFGQWAGVELSDKNHRMLWVPPCFAHGFYVLSESADFLYKCTDIYDPEHEVSLKWDDPEVGVEWPLIEGAQPALSDKDKAGLPFSKAPHF